MKDLSTKAQELILSSCGIDISALDETFLKRSLNRRVDATDCKNLKEYSKILEKNDVELGVFVNSLNIGYSEFFRNPLTFAVLEQIVLPQMILKMKTNGRKEIRIWSAACAKGQEPYSVAMLLSEMSKTNGPFKFRVFATDRFEPFVKAAAEGKFTEKELGGLNLKRIEKYFLKKGEYYFIVPEIKKEIDFSVFDLFRKNCNCPTASIFGDFDIVMCANILFYYKLEFQRIILEKAARCLAKNGFVIAGESEREILLQNNFKELFDNSSIFSVSETGRKK
jgi:chemotaxis methyl-accepting protein methylase